MAESAEKLAQAAEWVRHARRILVFSGAGISAESGIPTFRDDDGLWDRFPPDRFATWPGLLSAARKQPRALAEFLYAVLEPIAAAKPNAAHRAIANAEHHASIAVATQNVDGLHQDAGSTSVYEMHGSFLEIVNRRGRFHRLVARRELVAATARLKRCARGPLVLARVAWSLRSLAGVGWRGVHHPRLVLFGDQLAEPAWSQSLSAARECDVLLQIGCSGAVWPAASLPQEARQRGARVIAIDPQRAAADLWLGGGAVELVPRLFELAFGPGSPS